MDAAGPRPIIWGIHLSNAVLLVGMAIQPLTHWSELPARVPIHFNLEGIPDRWVGKGPEFALLFAVPWFVSALLYGLSRAMRYFQKHPELTNLPPRIRALPPERLEPLFASIRELLFALALATNLLFAAITKGTLGVAFGLHDRLSVWATWPWLFVLGAVLIAGLVRMFVVMRRLGGGAMCEREDVKRRHLPLRP
jgi:hypothetical protein